MFVSFHCEMRQLENSNSMRCRLYWAEMLTSLSYTSEGVRTLAILGLLFAQIRISFSKWHTEKCIWYKDSWFLEGLLLKVITSVQTVVHETVLYGLKLLRKIKLSTAICRLDSSNVHEPQGIWESTLICGCSEVWEPLTQVVHPFHPGPLPKTLAISEEVMMWKTFWSEVKIRSK